MKEALSHILHLGIKEIIGIFRDPLLLILIIYCFSLGVYIGAKAMPDSIDHAAIAIVDEDNSPLSKRLTDAFMPPLFLPPDKISSADVDWMMDKGKYTFIVVIPHNFQERVLANNRPELQLNVDATRMSQAFAGNGYIQQILTKEVNDFIKQNTSEAGLYTEEALVRSRFNPNLIAAWEGGISELSNYIAMLAMILTGAALIRERERGTLEHLMVTPIHPVEIMIAKVWSMSLVVFIASGCSVIFIIHMILKIPIAGSFALFMGGVLINLFAMTSLGIFLACFSRDMPQLGILMILVLLPMQILSGGKTSQANMPVAIQYIMLLSPTTYMVKICQAILFRGAEFVQIWHLFVKMLLLGAVYFLIALRRFRKAVAS